MQENTDRQYMIELAGKWLDGTILPHEEQAFADWYDDFFDEAPLAINNDFAESSEALRKRIYNAMARILAEEEESVRVEPSTEKPIRRFSRQRYLAAASIIALLGIGVYLILPVANRQNAPIKATATRDIAPGHDGAILTLAGGTKIILDSAANGAIASQGNMQVVKQNGRITYKKATEKLPALVIYNTMTTPRGRQYQLVLPDGSKVWLNAASSITYPTAFTGDHREVTITGEAYFEVVHSTKQPFRVKAGNTLVEDLGTHFNVNAYPEGPGQRTTLLEGAVRVSDQHNAVLLQPGQQAHSQGIGPIDILSKVDLDATMAWKNGNLSLQNADVKAIFNQISRWYDVDIQYEGAVPDKQIWGIIGRNVYLSNVLHVLDAEGIHTELKGKTIIVNVSKPNQTDSMK